MVMSEKCVMIEVYVEGVQVILYLFIVGRVAGKVVNTAFISLRLGSGTLNIQERAWSEVESI